MKSKRIRIGVLGCANIAIKSVIPAIIRRNDIFELYGIASRSPEKADKYASQFHSKAFYSYNELIEDENIHAIYIPLPNALHDEYIEKALKKGIHVLVEKSMACTLFDVQKLNELAKLKECVLIENFQFRFHPQINVIKELLFKGEIGELRSLRSSFGFPPFADKNNIRYDKALGGGALYDAGAYPIKISQIFLGNDLAVMGSSLKIDEKTQVDIWGGGFLKQKNGSMFSEIAFGFDHYYQCSIELWGSKGKISTNRIFTAPTDYEAEILLENNNGKKIIKVERSSHFENMLMFFHEMILTKSNRDIEYKNNIDQARLLEEFKLKSI